MRAAFALTVWLMGWLAGWSVAGDVRPDRLSCEYQANPLGIDTPRPRLSWTLASDRRNQQQSAYELQVSERAADLGKEKALLWASGRVTSGESLHIPYDGPALKPFSRYYWRVRVYDAAGQPSAWSPAAWFETAMLNPADWQAQWIGDGRSQFTRDEDFYGDDPMPLFRKAFEPARKVVSARLYVCGLGYYEAYLNGQKVGDHVLDPGWTAHRKQALYVTYDVTSLIRPGANALGVILGNGWYNPLPLRLFGRFNLRDVQQTGRPALKAQLRLQFADGTSAVIGTDASWQTAQGPVVRNNVYLGEHYDARRELANWSQPGSVGGTWKAAALTEGPSGALAPQMQPPVRVTRVVKPVRILEPKPGVYVFDLGQNFAGIARIRVQGPAGTRVTLRYGEDIHPDNSLNYLTTVAGQIKQIWNLKGGPGAPPTAWQEDSYVLKGSGGVETWSPRFTFHGFRYVEVTGWPGKPDLSALEGLRMNADLPAAGTFASSNDRLNRLQEVVQWTFLSNVFSVQSDCPGREKMGYGGDMVATAEAFIFNYDMAQFYRKTVQDFINDQQPDGGITEIVPYTGIADRGVGGESGPLGWQLAFPYLLKQLHDFYGDRQALEAHYPAFVRQIAFLRSKADRNLFHWDISDHEALDPRPEALTASAFYYHHLNLISEFAGILGKKDDSTAYAKQAATVKTAFIRKYLVPKTGRFDNATQTAQIFALWYGLSPEKDASWRQLEQELDRHQGHLSTGIFATKMFFDLMRQEDRNELAYRAVNTPTYPGWGYMLERGATTLWETWAYPDNAPSQNHPMFGSVSEWLYRSLLGINPLAPGFARVQIRPQPTGDLRWAKGSYRSVRGLIGSDWKQDGTTFRLTVDIPAGTKAEVWVPAEANSPITESGKPLPPEARLLRYEKGYAVLEAGSGHYAFESQRTR